MAALLALIAILAVGEFTVRTWIQAPAAHLDQPRFGLTYEPHARIVWSVEGYSISRTNSLGLSDDEPRVPRAPCVALLLGDSYAEALHVPRPENFLSVAERRMSGLDMINLGRPASFPADYAIELPYWYGRLHPDLVVVQINDGDVRELLNPAILARSRARARDEFGGRSPSPPTRSLPAQLARRLVRESGLANFAMIRLTMLGTKERERLGRKFGLLPVGFQESMSGPVDPSAGVLLDSLTQDMLQVTPRILFLYIPALDYTGESVRAAYPDRRSFFRAFAARNRVTLVDPTDGMIAEFARTRQPLHGFQNSVIGDVHLNERGHRIVGEELASAIREATK